MANEYVRDRAMRFSTKRRAEDVRLSRPAGPRLPPVRSVRGLAQEASAKFYPKITDKSERLRKKWGRQKQRWLDLVRFHDDLPETFETHALGRIWVSLSKAKVPIVPNCPAGTQCQRSKCAARDCRTLRNWSRSFVRGGAQTTEKPNKHRIGRPANAAESI
jgi:hypothetical protein